LRPCLATGFSANKPETIVDISSRSLWRKPEVPVSHEEYSNLCGVLVPTPATAKAFGRDLCTVQQY
jgi:hypothetical protein